MECFEVMAPVSIHYRFLSVILLTMYCKLFYGVVETATPLHVMPKLIIPPPV